MDENQELIEKIEEKQAEADHWRWHWDTNFAEYMRQLTSAPPRSGFTLQQLREQVAQRLGRRG